MATVDLLIAALKGFGYPTFDHTLDRKEKSNGINPASDIRNLIYDAHYGGSRNRVPPSKA